MHVQRLGVGGETLVDPEVGPVGHGHFVAPPLVRHLVEQQLVEAERVVVEGRSVGDQRLMLHAVVGSVRDRELVPEEGVLPEATAEHLEDARHLPPHLSGIRLRLRRRPEGQFLVQRAVDAEVGLDHRQVRRDVDRYQVVVDRVADPPLGGDGAVLVVELRHQPPVRQPHQPVRHREGDVHALVGLVGGMVLARPPDVAAVALAGDADPRPSGGGLRPHETVDPRRAQGHLRRALVRYRDPVPLVRAPGPRQLDPQHTAATAERSLRAVTADFGHLQAVVEVDLEPLQLGQGLHCHGVAAGDPLALGIDPYRQAVVQDVVGLHRRRYPATGVEDLALHVPAEGEHSQRPQQQQAQQHQAGDLQPSRHADSWSSWDVARNAPSSSATAAECM